jgi:hypothetical protein
MSNYTDVYNHKKEDEKQTERFTKFQVGLIAIGAVGAGMGIFGFVKGYQFGNRIGTRTGFVQAQQQFIEAAKVMAEEARKTEGE